MHVTALLDVSTLLQKVWLEFWRQMKLALFMLSLFLLASVVARRKLPWQA